MGLLASPAGASNERIFACVREFQDVAKGGKLFVCVCVCVCEFVVATVVNAPLAVVVVAVIATEVVAPTTTDDLAVVACE